MIAITARLTIKEGSEEAAEKLFAALIQQFSGDPETLAYTVFRDPGAPRVYTIFEQYLDEAAHDAHTSSAGFKELQPQLVAVLDGRPEVVTGAVVASTLV